MSTPAMRPRMRAMMPKSRFSPIIGGPTNPLYLSLVSRGAKAVARLFNSFGRSGLGGGGGGLPSRGAGEIFFRPQIRGRKSPRKEGYPRSYPRREGPPAGGFGRVFL